jgi:hypothetical protein
MAAPAAPDSPAPFGPAPLDRAALARVLAPFGESTMLPPAAYTSQAVFDWERKNFFAGGWMCVARGDQLPGAGDQRAEDTGNGGVLLARGEDGVVRAFANYCRHRGHELLPRGSATSGHSLASAELFECYELCPLAFSDNMVASLVASNLGGGDHDAGSREHGRTGDHRRGARHAARIA